ncbi:hypothetical protein LCGC14_2735870 [marine sediment metagenome]|uniref:Uncharacterized protein n=1 Tax=marine sediment metagenome TaxID=412755 RepID=A0A0F8Z5X9_9ZZZZ
MSKLRLSVSYSESYEVIMFSVLDEDDKEVIRQVYKLSDIPADNSAHVHAYGLNKVLTDRTSDEKDKVAKLTAMDEVFDLLCAGEWAKERQVGAVVVSPEVEALAEIMDLTIPETQAALAAYEEPDRFEIPAYPEVVCQFL